jgi:hypothetical protein
MGRKVAAMAPANDDTEEKEPEWQPTEKQKFALTHAYVLHQLCLTLGIEWDPRVLRKDLTLNTGRYNDLRMRTGRALIPKLAHDLNRQDAWENAGDFLADIPYSEAQPDTVIPNVGFTLIELILLAKRTGWLPSLMFHRDSYRLTSSAVDHQPDDAEPGEAMRTRIGDHRPPR